MADVHPSGQVEFLIPFTPSSQMLKLSPRSHPSSFPPSFSASALSSSLLSSMKYILQCIPSSPRCLSLSHGILHLDHVPQQPPSWCSRLHPCASTAQCSHGKQTTLLKLQSGSTDSLLEPLKSVPWHARCYIIWSLPNPFSSSHTTMRPLAELHPEPHWNSFLFWDITGSFQFQNLSFISSAATSSHG